MNIHQLALLTGLFLVPLAALAVGHRLARRGPRARNLFWGLVAGHTVAALAAAAVALLEPEFWGAADRWRGLVGYWGMLVLPLLLGAVGYLRPPPDESPAAAAGR